jgi:hypothetical protein
MKTLTHTFQISDDAWKLLLSIQKEGYAEYRDHHYNTLEEYLQDHPGDLEYQTKRFLARNHGGTYYLVGELLKYNLIEDVEDSWHITYKVTKFAKELIAIELRDEKIVSVIN